MGAGIASNLDYHAPHPEAAPKKLNDLWSVLRGDRETREILVDSLELQITGDKFVVSTRMQGLDVVGM